MPASNSSQIGTSRPAATAKQVAASLLVLLPIGCGRYDDGLPERGPVTGTVLLDGQPVPKGVVKFVPLEPADAPAVPISFDAGRFDVPASAGPFVGRHRVEVFSTDDGGYPIDSEAATEDLAKLGRRAKIEVVRVPAQYGRNSTLEANITAEGPNDLSLELSSNQRRPGRR